MISRRAALLGLGAIGAAATKAVAAVEVGDMAPDFSLPATDGKTVTLAQHKGKSNVVLAFYPKAFTGGRSTIHSGNWKGCREVHRHSWRQSAVPLRRLPATSARKVLSGPD